MSAASNFVTALLIAPVSFVRRSVGTALLARKALERHHLTEPLLYRLSRSTAPTPTGRYVTIDVAGGGKLCSLADGHVVIHTDTSAQHDKIFQSRTAGN